MPEINYSWSFIYTRSPAGLAGLHSVNLQSVHLKDSISPKSSGLCELCRCVATSCPRSLPSAGEELPLVDIPNLKGRARKLARDAAPVQADNLMKIGTNALIEVKD